MLGGQFPESDDSFSCDGHQARTINSKRMPHSRHDWASRCYVRCRAKGMNLGLQRLGILAGQVGGVGKNTDVNCVGSQDGEVVAVR